ncbi:AraC family transcriptional regulator [Vibrio sp. ABG19]|uniref:AraC family transcriptional regulator n=1 Tax=Vibrio sp. ABG19 TaxID=2817385 RepID=UPI00249F3216|nr:AraC family transcriptional regulator [Vibrio sp. ABG19]WGY46137.1 helix-turn-helix transcriptional regulator [Vibrio sp. ABG19]
MAGKYQGHWLGSPLTTLPRRVQDVCKHYFDVVEHGSDVSVLSEPDVSYALFFYQKDRCQGLLLTSLKICMNLNKYLIIIHDGSYKNSIGHQEPVLALLDISEDEPSMAISGICEKLNNNVDQQTIEQQVLHSPKSPHSLSKEMLDILRYIDLNITKEIREEDIAEYCHYSISYFSKRFHKVIGVSFRDYICDKRIAMAKRLLVDEKNAKIAFIAYQCGYRDVSYFSRIFKKKTGISPGAFRQLHSR